MIFRRIIYAVFIIFVLSQIIGLEKIILILSRYDELIELFTALLLAYVTWQYAHASQQTLKFMKYSFEKEYEEDIKFMFIKLKKEMTGQFLSRVEESKLVQNNNMIDGSRRIDNGKINYDNNLLSLRLFNSGRRLISHVKIEYIVDILDNDKQLSRQKRIEMIVPKTLQPNDYITIPLVKVGCFYYIKIKVLSLKSFNGLGEEQLDNSPQREFLYRNNNL